MRFESTSRRDPRGSHVVIEQLFAAVREQCPADAWSTGVSLSRAGAVVIESSDAEEIKGRVALIGKAFSPTVALYPEDGEWDCDCDSALDTCEHVAATVIALRQGTGQTARSPKLEYRLRSEPAGYFFERGFEDEGGFHAVDMPLEAIATGRFQGPELEVGAQDLAVEKALRGTLRGLLRPESLPRVFRALSKVDVSLDGEPVRVSGEARRLRVLVEDAAQGFRLAIAPSTEDTDEPERELRPPARDTLSGRERSELSRGRTYALDDVAELVGAVLPSLSARVDLDIRTDRLPSSRREPARPSVRLERRGRRLHVRPGIVYGDPPVARVEQDRLLSIGGVVPIRQPESEKAAAARLSQELGLTTGVGYELETEEAMAFVARLERFDGHVDGDVTTFRLLPELVPKLSVGAGDFELSFDGAEPNNVLRSWRAGETLVDVAGGGFAPLPVDWLEQFGDEVSDLLAAREASGVVPHSALPALARLCEELGEPPPPDWEPLERLLADFDSLPDADIGATLDAVLRDYQREGVNWLVFQKRARLGCLLADDMGLGKTLQALCVLEKPSLVVAPVSVLQNWADEAKRFRPELSVALFHGPDRRIDPDADVTITSHALLRLSLDDLAKVDWDTVVIDEAQAIRNPDTALAQAAYSLGATFRLALTGTPVENRVLDLWSQLHFLNPGFLGSREDFDERYARPIGAGGTDELDRLQERVRPFVKRRLKADVAPELPPRTDMTLRVELDADERRTYEAVRAAARKDVAAKLSGKANVNVMQALEMLLRLRQAACHPSLVPGQKADSSSKVELLVDRLRVASAEGHKSLVFSQWTSMLDLIAPRLESEGIVFTRLDGSTRDRAAVVSRFQSDADVSVFLLSLKAGGTGLNLTAADHVFLFEPWWNPAVEQQAFDRAHRIGQDKPVFVHRLIASATVEEGMERVQRDKRAVAEGVVGASSDALTRDILLQLLV